MKKIVFVCLGNICRSPMAEFVMKELDKGESLHIESRATSSWSMEIQFIKVPKKIFKEICYFF